MLFLGLTPCTGDGIIFDDAFKEFCTSMDLISEELLQIIQEQQESEEEKAIHNILLKIQRAFKEAFLSLPVEEYQWLDIFFDTKKIVGEKKRAS